MFNPKTNICREDLEGLKPNMDKLLGAHKGDVVKGVIVTIKGSANYHAFSRYFAPWNGIPEDPVTGDEILDDSFAVSEASVVISCYCCYCYGSYWKKDIHILLRI